MKILKFDTDQMSPKLRRWGCWVGIISIFVLVSYLLAILTFEEESKRTFKRKDDIIKEVFSGKVGGNTIAGLSGKIEKYKEELEAQVYEKDMLNRKIDMLKQEISRKEVQIQKDTLNEAKKEFYAELDIIVQELEKRDREIDNLKKMIETREINQPKKAVGKIPSNKKYPRVEEPTFQEEQEQEEQENVFATRNPEVSQPVDVNLNATGGHNSIAKARKVSIRSLSQERTAINDDEKTKKNESTYIPAGSIFSGTLLTGMDAPTGQQARSNPYPVLMRIKKEAILPNRYHADVRECFLVAGGYGELSSERVYIRSEALSCVRTDGGVVEAPVEMFSVGEDGKNGVRGRLVSKQGQFLARSMVAGFMSGFANVFGQTPVPTIVTENNDNVVPYQKAFSEEALQSATISGAGDALDRLAQFYIDMAENIFPVLEVDAGRKIDFVMLKGTEFKLY